MALILNTSVGPINIKPVEDQIKNAISIKCRHYVHVESITGACLADVEAMALKAATKCGCSRFDACVDRETFRRLSGDVVAMAQFSEVGQATDEQIVKEMNRRGLGLAEYDVRTLVESLKIRLGQDDKPPIPTGLGFIEEMARLMGEVGVFSDAQFQARVTELLALEKRCERAEVALMEQAKAVVVVDDHAVTDEVLRQLEPGKVISLVELRNQGLALRRVVDAQAHVVSVPNADAMRFTCADGTTVDVATDALKAAMLVMVNDAQRDAAARVLSSTEPWGFGLIPKQEHSVTPFLDALAHDRDARKEQAQKERDLAANARYLAEHGAPGFYEKHDRIGSKCTLPHCPHPHDPAPTSDGVFNGWAESCPWCDTPPGAYHRTSSRECERWQHRSLKELKHGFVESGPGIARLPEPHPEPLAFLDEDLLADDA